MTRGCSCWRRWCLPVLLGALLIQFAATYITKAATGRELWPAILLPGFGGVFAESELEVSRLEIDVHGSAGERESIDLRALLAGIPRSMQVAVAQSLRDAGVGSPEVRAWVLRRASLAIGRDAQHVTLRWIRSSVAKETGEELASEPQEELHVSR